MTARHSGRSGAPRRIRPLLLAAAAAAAPLLVPRPAVAQDGFLFSRPLMGVTARVGPMLYSARGDVFAEITELLTLERSDFRAPLLSAELLLMPLPRIDLAVGIGWAETRNSSEFRDLVEEDAQGNQLPIRQVTEFRTVPFSLNVRYQLLPRGERISELAWVPRRTTPYVGGGFGITNYRLVQQGDMVDLATNIISSGTWETSGTASSWQLVAGADHWLTPRLGLNAEARYIDSSVTPGQSFARYREIDLGGLQASIGLTLRW